MTIAKKSFFATAIVSAQSQTSGPILSGKLIAQLDPWSGEK